MKMRTQQAKSMGYNKSCPKRDTSYPKGILFTATENYMKT